LGVVRRRRSSPQTAAVLAALARQPARWRHGYDLAKETGLASGTLYPILMRLEQRGALEAHWQRPERPGRPARHAYRLTGEGRRLAQESAPALQLRLREAAA
jgi:PadR family transcriptional regulator